MKIAQLAQTLRENGIDAYFANSPVSMGYLHGFWEFGHERFLILAVAATGDCRLICPALSASQAKRAGIEDVRSWADGEHPLSLLSNLARDWRLDTAIIAVDDEMPALTLLQCQSTLPAALFKPGGEVLSSLMRVKTQDEIEVMRRAGKVADQAYHDVLPKLRPGLTELEVTKMINDAMSTRGGQPSFCIVAAGANSAEPHHLSDSTKLQQDQIVLMDFGCEIDGYKSDITRTVCLGAASDRQREVYRIVFEAQAAAQAFAKSGIAAADVDATARRVIDEAGYGERFIHRTGHGIGLRGHEDPYIVQTNSVPLQTGNCFSIEPGIYLPGEFGVRIETIVAVSENGLDPLNEDPSPVLVEVGV